MEARTATGFTDPGTFSGFGWLNPALVALVLTASVLVLDVLLPNLPGAQGGLVGRLTALMSGVCPQRPGHSYTLGGVQLPLEARMMGMFGGVDFRRDRAGNAWSQAYPALASSTDCSGVAARVLHDDLRWLQRPVF